LKEYANAFLNIDTSKNIKIDKWQTMKILFEDDKDQKV
jgi:hypothetical protein